MQIKLLSLILLAFESLLLLAFYTSHNSDLNSNQLISQLLLSSVEVILYIILALFESKYHILQYNYMLILFNILTLLQLIQLMELILIFQVEIYLIIVLLHLLILYDVDRVILNYKNMTLLRWGYVLIRIIIIYKYQRQGIVSSIQIILISLLSLRQHSQIQILNEYSSREVQYHKNDANYLHNPIIRKQLKFAKTFDSLTASPDRERKEYRIIDKFPEGVALVAFNDDEPGVIYSNEVVKQLLKIEDKEKLLEKISQLKELQQVQQMQKDEDAVVGSSSYKSFSFDLQNEFDANFLIRAKRAVTNEKFAFRSWNRSDDQNPFFRVLLQVRRYFFRSDIQSVLEKCSSSYDLFATLNGYLNNRCIEIKVFISYISKQPQVLLLARDVSHRDFIKLLQESNKAKQNSLNFVSHEFRTPLNCIITMLESCEEEDHLNGLKHLKTAIQNCYYLLNLSNDLLDLAQMKVGKFKLVKHNFNLYRLLQQCTSMFSVMASQKQIKLNLFVDQSVPQNVKTDENRIKQVVMNLLGNAFKFTLKGCIQIQVNKIHIDTLRICITDTGIGIKEEDKGNLLVAFGKSESDENKKLNRQGVGLGLLISNMIARNLNNSNTGLQFQSNYGVGSSFYFDVDLDSETQEPIQSRDRQESPERINSIQEQQIYQIPDKDHAQRIYTLSYQKSLSQVKKKVNKDCNCPDILIVDDIQFNIEALILILSKKINEKKIEYVISGEMAIEIVKKRLENICCNKYRLIFMDIEMPGMDGFETYKQINQLFLSRGLRVSVVACSGYSSEKEKQKAIKLEMADYLEKPLKRSEVERIINTFLLYK